MEFLIKAFNLKVHFPLRGALFGKQIGSIKAVDGVSLNIQKGSFVSVVGESGSGKSTLSYAVLGLVPITSGQLFLKENEIDIANKKSWQPYRKKFQIIYQDFSSSLNPRNTILEIISKPLIFHNVYPKKEIEARVVQSLKEVGMEGDDLYRYPHAFSGGQRQRINIARSLSLNPELLICDEIVSALDVRIQFQIMGLIKHLQHSKKLTLLFISHDLATVKNVSDFVHVMYQGKIVESSSAKNLFTSPRNPYTLKLINSSPSLDLAKRKRKKLANHKVNS